MKKIFFILLIFILFLTACSAKEKAYKEEPEIPTWIEERIVEEWKEENEKYFQKRPTIGRDDAPIVIAMMANFTCDDCKRWHDEIYPWIKSEYIDKGLVQLTFINTPFDKEKSIEASLASLAIYNQKKEQFWKYFDYMYENGNTKETLHLTDNIDKKQVLNDIASRKHIKMLEEDNSFSLEHNLTKVPTFSVNGYRLDYPFDKEKIKEFLNELKKYEKQKNAN